MNSRNVRAAALFGLLEPSEPPEPTETPLLVKSRGHWDVLYFSGCVTWRCKCGRSEPFRLTLAAHDRVELPFDGVHACEVCRSEILSARTQHDRFWAWFNQHRACIDPERCLEFPGDGGKLRGPDDSFYTTTRRNIFTQFWSKPVQKEHSVRSSCLNLNCINPYHLCLTSSPRTPLTNQAKKFLEVLVLKKVSTGTIKQLLQEKLSIELSERSIQRIKKDITKYKSCAF